MDIQCTALPGESNHTSSTDISVSSSDTSVLTSSCVVGLIYPALPALDFLCNPRSKLLWPKASLLCMELNVGLYWCCLRLRSARAKVHGDGQANRLIKARAREATVASELVGVGSSVSKRSTSIS